MNDRIRFETLIGVTISVAAALMFFSAAAGAADEAAARALARESNCFKCHAVDRKKDGPAWKDIAAKYREKGDPAKAQARLITHITTGEKAKFADGHEEEHAIVKTKDQNEIKNLVDWILSLK
jgi:cytochrome c